MLRPIVSYKSSANTSNNSLLYEFNSSTLKKDNNVLNIELFTILFKSNHINILLYSNGEKHNDLFDLIEKEFHIYMNNLYGVIFRSSLSKEEITMIHIDYILRNEYSTYLDYIFFEELYEFMAVSYTHLTLPTKRIV